MRHGSTDRGYRPNRRQILAMGSALAAGAAGVRPALASTPFRIGLNLERTGNAASYGGHVLIASRIAAEEINAAGGINGRQVEIVVEDNRSLPEQAVIATRNLDQAGVVAVVGPIQSSQARTAFPATNRAKLVSISSGSSAPGISAQNRPWAFRNASIDKAIFGGTCDVVRRRYPDAKTILLTYDPKDAYQTFLIKTVAPPELKRVGLETLNQDAPMEIPVEANDHSVFVTRIKSTKPDIVLVGLVVEQGRTFLREMSRQQYKIPLIGGVGFVNDGVAKSAGDLDFYSGQPFNPYDTDPTVQKFVKEFAARSEKELPGQYTIPSYIEAGAYESVRMIADALRPLALDADLAAQRAAVRDSLVSLKGYNGLGNSISFNSEGDAEKPPLVFHTVGGKWELIR